MQAYPLFFEIWVNLVRFEQNLGKYGQNWSKSDQYLGKFWLYLGKIKILHSQKLSISCGYDRKVAKPWFDSRCGGASLCPWEGHFSFWGQAVYLSWWSSLTKIMQTELFCVITVVWQTRNTMVHTRNFDK